MVYGFSKPPTSNLQDDAFVEGAKDESDLRKIVAPRTINPTRTQSKGVKGGRRRSAPPFGI